MMIIHSLQKMPDWLTEGMLVLVGGYIGCLLSALITHLPQNILDSKEYSLIMLRSFCPQCRKKIHWHNHLPIIAYFLRKKTKSCLYCTRKIIAQQKILYALITILTSLIVYHLTGPHYTMLIGLMLSWWLIALFAIDLKYYLLPDQLTLSLLWVGLLINLHGFLTPLQHAVLGAVLGYGLCWLIDTLYYSIRKKNGFGQGDWKLLAALGAWFGVGSVFYLLAIAAILGTFFGIIGLINKKLHMASMIPFGPFLCIAAWLWFFLGKNKGF